MEQNNRNMKLIVGVRKTIAERLSNYKKDIVQTTRTVMQNIGIASGAVATAGIIAISSPLTLNIGFMLSGIVLLLAETFFVFLYIILSLRRETKSVLKMKENILDPLDRFITLWDKLKDEKIDQKIFDKETEDILANQLRKEHRAGHDIDQTKSDYSIDNKDLWFISVLGIGTLLIVLGLLAPHIPRSWYNQTNAVSQEKQFQTSIR